MAHADDLSYLELTEVAELIRSRQLSSVEVTEAILGRISVLDPGLRSYAHVSSEAALLAAKTADAEIGRGHYRGPLHGVPVAVKDLCFTTDAPTASGGIVHAGYLATHDATVVSRLRDAGGVIVGKLRMTEGAFTHHHPDLPTPVNPWDPGTWSGVSSSGSGVATAAGLCFGALGTDTGGSIRLPSAMNGVTGLKPTWGRVSRYGVTALAETMDHIGPITRSAKDCAAMLTVLAGVDVNDPTSSLLPVPDYLGELRLQRPPRVGVDRTLMETFDEPTCQMLEGVLQVVRELGWPVVEVETPDLPAVANDWAPMCAVETAHEHKDTYPDRAGEYGPALRDLIELGLSIPVVTYQEMLLRRAAFTGRLRRLFTAVDLLLVPGTGFASPTLELMGELGTNEALLSALLTPTAPFDMSGSPTITLPGGLTDRGTPLGFQLVGREFDEALVLQAGHAYQSVTAFHRAHPTLNDG